jgi:hypothetical protein
MSRASGHAWVEPSCSSRSSWLEHAGAAAIIALLVAVLWRPTALGSSPTNGDREDRVGELAALLGAPVANRAEVERILPTATRFPPNDDATRALAGALSACDMSGLSDARRAQLARHIYATTTGEDLPRDRLVVTLQEIQETAIEARCSPLVITAIVDSARRVARIDPKPRRDWW